MHRRTLFAFVVALAGLSLVAQDGAAKKPRLAFVTNCVAEFWTVATFGVEAAKSEFDVEAVVRMPANGTAEEQKRILEDLLAKGVQGIALSPKDPENMTALLDKVAGRAVLVTHDSDAPKSKRLAYVGMDNYDAGRMCGQLVKSALPNGGPVVIVVGNPGPGQRPPPPPGSHRRTARPVARPQPLRQAGRGVQGRQVRDPGPRSPTSSTARRARRRRRTP